MIISASTERLRGFNAELGFRIAEWRTDFARIEMTLEEWHLNRSGVVHGGGRGDDGNEFEGVAVFGGGVSCVGVEVEGEDVLDGEFLGGEDAVKTLEGEGAFFVEEV